MLYLHTFHKIIEMGHFALTTNDLPVFTSICNSAHVQNFKNPHLPHVSSFAPFFDRFLFVNLITYYNYLTVTTSSILIHNLALDFILVFDIS